MMDSLENWYYFKRVFTDKTHYAELNQNWTVAQFIEEMGERLKPIFHVRLGQSIEFVPMQTIGNIDNNESSPVLVPSEQTVRDAFYRNRVFGFYVRVVPDATFPVIPEAVICIICEEVLHHPPIPFYQCTHMNICNTCFRQCCHRGLLQCPICRADIIL